MHTASADVIICRNPPGFKFFLLTKDAEVSLLEDAEEVFVQMDKICSGESGFALRMNLKDS